MTNTKRIVRSLLPPVVFDVTRPFRQTLAMRAYRRDKHHQYGYTLYRQRFIKRSLANQALLESLRSNAPLPPGYGIDVDERCVEFPWVMAHLGAAPDTVLDAGSTLNHAYIITAPNLANKTLHILTLAPEGECFWQRGLSYMYADLRSIPMRDAFYDTVVCASVLEHVGFDNTMYAEGETYREDRPNDFLQVMRELRRVLKPGGRLLLSVPYGRYERHHWFQLFDRDLLTQALDAFGPSSMVSESFFRYTAEGWQQATDDACRDVSYGGDTRGAGAVACVLVVT